MSFAVCSVPDPGKPVPNAHESYLPAAVRAEAHQAPEGSDLHESAPPSLNPFTDILPSQSGHSFGQLGSGKGSIAQGFEDRVDRFVHHLVAQSVSVHPPPFGADGVRSGGMNVGVEVSGGEKVDGCPHAPRFNEASCTPEALINLVSGEVAGPCPERDSGLLRDLALNAARASHGGHDVMSLVEEMLTLHSESEYLS